MTWGSRGRGRGSCEREAEHCARACACWGLIPPQALPAGILLRATPSTRPQVVQVLSLKCLEVHGAWLGESLLRAGLTHRVLPQCVVNHDCCKTLLKVSPQTPARLWRLSLHLACSPGNP